VKILLGNGISEKKDEPVPDGCTVQEVMALKGLTGQTVITVLNGAVIHPETRLKEGDELELVGVIYGG